MKHQLRNIKENYSKEEKLEEDKVNTTFKFNNEIK